MKNTELFDLGKNLKRIRKLRGLSQEQMAEKIFMSVRGYQKYEQGATWPRPNKLALLANVLEVNVAELLGKRHEDWQEGGLLKVYEEKLSKKKQDPRPEIIDEIMGLKANVMDLRSAIIDQKKLPPHIQKIVDMVTPLDDQDIARATRAIQAIINVKNRPLIKKSKRIS